MRGLGYGAVRALVTGGAGFIGSHVVDALLARGDEVTVVDDLSSGRRELVDARARLVEHDIREPFETDAEVVLHLAAQADVGTSMERPGFDAEVNVAGTVNVLEAARAAGAHVVFASTGGAIYGDVERPAAEDDELRPVSPYGIAKLAAEAYVEGWGRIHGAGHVVLRFANVYGPRQSPTLEGGVVAIFLDRMAAGEPTLIFGDGEQTRDFVHVSDVVGAVLAAAERRGGIFNVGTGVETSVTELHGGVRGRGTGRAACSRRAPGDADGACSTPSRAAAGLGWRARTSSNEGSARPGRRCGRSRRARRRNHRAAWSIRASPTTSFAPGAPQPSWRARSPPSSSSSCSSLGVTLLAKPVAAEVREAAEHRVLAPVAVERPKPSSRSARRSSPARTPRCSC